MAREVLPEPGSGSASAAIHERGLAGRGPVPAPDPSDQLQSRTADPRTIIRNWGRLTTEVAPLVCPILLLIRSAAATDAAMARLLAETDHQRLQRMTPNAHALRGHLRPGITQSAAAEILWTYSSPDLYDLLITRRHWPLLIAAVGLVALLVASFLEQGKAAAQKGTSWFVEATAGWQ